MAILHPLLLLTRSSRQVTIKIPRQLGILQAPWKWEILCMLRSRSRIGGCLSRMVGHELSILFISVTVS